METQSEIRDRNQSRNEGSRQGPEQSQISQLLLKWKKLHKVCFLSLTCSFARVMHPRGGGGSYGFNDKTKGASLAVVP